MSFNVNRAAVAGVLNFQPEPRSTQNGQAFCKTGLSIVESWTDRKTGEVKESKVIVKLIAWGDLAAQLSECQQGETVYVEGALKGDKKKDGSWETVVSIRFLQRLGVSDAPAPAPTRGEKAGSERRANEQREFGEDGEVPF